MQLGRNSPAWIMTHQLCPPFGVKFEAGVKGEEGAFRKGWFSLGPWRSGMIRIGREERRKDIPLGRNEMYKGTEAGMYRLYLGNN